MKKNDAFPSRFLKADDLEGRRIKLTIATMQDEELGQGKDKKLGHVLYFQEIDKGLVLNITNWDAIVMVTGHEDSDNWQGATVILKPEMVVFKGDHVPAIRVEVPARFAKPQIKPQPNTAAASKSNGGPSIHKGDIGNFAVDEPEWEPDEPAEEVIR